jgi:hypothetical protein
MNKLYHLYCEYVKHRSVKRLFTDLLMMEELEVKREPIIPSVSASLWLFGVLYLMYFTYIIFFSIVLYFIATADLGIVELTDPEQEEKFLFIPLIAIAIPVGARVGTMIGLPMKEYLKVLPDTFFAFFLLAMVGVVFKLGTAGFISELEKEGLLVTFYTRILYLAFLPVLMEIAFWFLHGMETSDRKEKKEGAVAAGAIRVHLYDRPEDVDDAPVEKVVEPGRPPPKSGGKRKNRLVPILIIVLIMSGFLYYTEPWVREMSSNEVARFLSDPANLDPELLAEDHRRFGVSYLEKEVDGTAAIDLVRLDRDNYTERVRLVHHQSAGGVSYGYEVSWGPAGVINYQVGDQFYHTDEVPQDADERFTGLLAGLVNTVWFSPDRGEQLGSLVWDVHVGNERYHRAHIAVWDNSTHTIKVVIQDEPRRLLYLEEKIGYPDDPAELSRMVEFFYDAEVEITEPEKDHHRTSVDLRFEDEPFLSPHQGTGWFDVPRGVTRFRANLSHEHDQEVDNDLVELHLMDGSGGVVVSMNLTITQLNISVVAESLKNSWNDADGNGLVSAGDGYLVETDDPDWQELRVRFYDLWAVAYEGGPVRQ